MEYKIDYRGAIVAFVLCALALFGIIDANTRTRRGGEGLERLPEVSGDIREAGGRDEI